MALDTVSLSAEALLRIYAAGQRDAGVPWTASVDVVRVTATTAADWVAYTLEYDVRVNAAAPSGGKAAAQGWVTVPLASGLTLLSSNVAVPPAPEAGAAAAASSGYVVASAGGQHALLAQGAGVYRVTLQAQGAYTGKAKAQAALWLPPAGRCELAFTVAGRDNVQIAAEPALNTALRSGGGATTLTALVPATSSLTVKWTEASVAAAAAAAAEDAASVSSSLTELQPAPAPPAAAAVALPLSITVDQEHLYSLGEGILQLSSRFTYGLRNGSVAAVAVTLDPRVRVLAVSGAYVLRWEVTAPVLHVVLDRNVDDALELRLEAEVDLGATSCTFTAPVFSHQAASVTRERGTVGVCARTNVEVDQARAPAGCVAADIGELSEDLRAAAATPLLLAYRFLQPAFDLQLAVKRHGDVDVCTALADCAAFTMTLTEQGQVMKRLVLSLRNSGRQYLRVYLTPPQQQAQLAPPAYELWSTRINGRPVKPATDGEAVMVSLRATGTADAAAAAAADADTDVAFPVELVWVEPGRAALGTHGLLDVTLPRVDVPVAVMLASLWLPSEYRYGEFVGDVPECRDGGFSVPLPASEPSAAAAAANAFGGGMPVPFLSRQSSVMRLDMCEKEMAVCDNDDSDGGEMQEEFADLARGMKMKKSAKPFAMMRMAAAPPPPPPPPPAMAAMYGAPPGSGASLGGGGGAPRGRAGVVPVQVDMVTSGREFRFERLLLDPEEPALKLSVAYRRKPEPRQHAS